MQMECIACLQPKLWTTHRGVFKIVLKLVANASKSKLWNWFEIAKHVILEVVNYPPELLELV